MDGVFGCILRAAYSNYRLLFFLLWNLLILILQIMEHLTAGTTFFFMFVFISFFFYCSPRIGAKVKDAFSAFVGKRKHIRRRIYRLG